MKNKLQRCAYLLASVSLTSLSANAANSLYAPGDLVMTFQQVGSTNTVYANLGNAATLFRGAASGSNAPSILNIINLNATLSSAFGNTWATDTSIYAGAVGVFSSDGDSTAVVNGDPAVTLYYTKSRTAVGTVGSASSTSVSFNTSGQTAMVEAAGKILSSNNVLENAETASYTTISLTSVSQIDEQNPFSSPNIQGAAYGTLTGGVQQRGGLLAFGTFGDAGSTEFALDLYRGLTFEGLPDQVTGTGVARRNTFEGTIALGTDGNVSFLTGVAPIPEPSSALLGLLGAIASLGYRRRTAQ